jgi:putative ABC transport system permease protein
MTDWTIILRSMRARLFSTVTTVITVAVAVALMLVLLTMQDAARSTFERGGGNMHLLLSRDASPLTSVLNGVFYVNAPRAPILHKEYEQFLANPLVDWAVPVQLGDSYQARYAVVATTPEFFSKFTPDPHDPWEFASGRAFAKDFEVVVGSTVARAAKLKLGDKIVLTHSFPDAKAADAAAGHEHGEFQYEVVGVLRPTGQAHDRAVFTSLMSTWIIHAFDRMEREHGAEEGHDDHDHEGHDHEGMPAGVEDVTDDDKKITNIFVRARTREGADASPAIQMLFDRLRRGQVFPGQVTVAQPYQELTRLMNIVGNVDRIILAIAGVVMVSSGIAIMLALYNSMEQRRRQIAVLRVLGASQARVLGLVLTESALLGLMGAAAGIVLAIGGGWAAAAAVKQALELTIVPTFQPVQVVAVVVATVVLASLAGLVPALAAYRTSVMRNLRPLG